MEAVSTGLVYTDKYVFSSVMMGLVGYLVSWKVTSACFFFLLGDKFFFVCFFPDIFYLTSIHLHSVMLNISNKRNYNQLSQREKPILLVV